MRILRVITTWAAAITLYCGYCGIASAAPPDKDLPSQLVDQLNLSKKALGDRGLPLQLVSYAPAASLDTDAAVRTVQAQFVADSTMVPQYNGVDASSFSISSIRERKMALVSGLDAQDVVANIKSMVFPSIKKGQKTLDVTWESQGRKFQTRLIYDDKGVVYDNVLSNLVFVETEKTPTEAPPPVPKEAESEAARRNANWSTRFLDYTIKWVWGATRGKILLDHYVVTCDGWRSFCDDGGQANAWMSLGHSEGKTHRNALRKPRISKLAWAYGWATPTASISIKFDVKKLTFSASTGGLGSAGKGTGIHTID
jgi:hypothetical protein